MKQFEIVISIYFLLGVLLTIFAFLGFLSLTFLGSVFLFILILFLYLFQFIFRKISSFGSLEIKIIYSLIFIWSIHFLQVLVPETGFDALWYHLPVIKEILLIQKLTYLPDLYQSVNPLFSDLYFLSGYSVLGTIGTKIIAYIFSIFLISSVYYLSRIFLSRKYSLVLIAIVSVFQVVSWQSASFYIDIPKAFFEISGLYFILSDLNRSKQKNRLREIVGLLFFSASLATKLFSIILLPIVLFVSYLTKRSFENILVNCVIVLLLPSFYYSFSYIHTGELFYSFTEHFRKLSEIGGEESIVRYVLLKSIQLPRSILLFFSARDYVFPLLPFFFIPIVAKWKEIVSDKKIASLLFFSISQWFVWWFVPPLSTRYALSGFITLLILGLTVVTKYYIQSNKQEKIFAFFLLSFVFLLFLPRLMIAKRSLQYILTPQTQREYLEQFYDGSIDEKIDAWYFK